MEVEVDSGESFLNGEERERVDQEREREDEERALRSRMKYEKLFGNKLWCLGVGL